MDRWHSDASDTETDTRARPTAVALVWEHVREAILCGQLEPGQWLRQEDLAASLVVSRMPIRAALDLLSHEGLVEQFPRRGARVVPLSVEELEEVYAARIGLEGLTARYSAERIDSSSLAELRQALPRLAALSAAGERTAYLAEDRHFMEGFFAASGRQRLCRQIAQLRGRAQRYLHLVFDVADRMQWIDFSYRLFQASAAANADEAEQVAEEALRWTLAQARPLVESHLAERSRAVRV
jgi:DNA-binding GntR family transcriptional regulator